MKYTRVKKLSLFLLTFLILSGCNNKDDKAIPSETLGNDANLLSIGDLNENSNEKSNSNEEVKSNKIEASASKENEENQEKNDDYSDILEILNNEEFTSTSGPSTPHSKLAFNSGGAFTGDSVLVCADQSDAYGDYKGEEFVLEYQRSNFVGNLLIEDKIDQYSYKVSLNDFAITNELGPMESVGGEKYSYGVDYAVGIKANDEFILFTKDTPRQRLAEESEFLAKLYDWYVEDSGYITYMGSGDRSLGYILYNKTQDLAFHQWLF